MARGRNDNLNKSADIVCRAAYELCRAAKRAGNTDVKQLKELCGVLKEAVGISQSLDKSAETSDAGITVTFDADMTDYLG